MPRYEVVAHLSVELDGATPEEAAAVYRRRFLADDGLALQDLAVWPCSHDRSPSALPPSLQQQLTDFFAAVAGHAAIEEATFRARVEAIFAETAPNAGCDDASSSRP
jgi:hypothetical protein